MAVNRRLLAASIGAALAISVAGGWAVARTSGDSEDVTYDSAVVEQIPSIGTNAQVSGDPLPDVMLVDNEATMCRCSA